MITTEELIELAHELEHDADLIEHQIELAEAKDEMGLAPIDRVWRANASYAAKCKRRQHDTIERILTYRERGEITASERLTNALAEEIGYGGVEDAYY